MEQRANNSKKTTDRQQHWCQFHPLEWRQPFLFTLKAFYFLFLKQWLTFLSSGQREKKHPLLSAWLGVSPVPAKVSCQFYLIHSYAHISHARYSLGNSIFVQDTGGTAEILYHSNTKQENSPRWFPAKSALPLAGWFERKVHISTYQYDRTLKSYDVHLLAQEASYFYNTGCTYMSNTNTQTHPCMHTHNFSKCFTEAAKGSHVLDIVWYDSKKKKRQM